MRRGGGASPSRVVAGGQKDNDHHGIAALRRCDFVSRAAHPERELRALTNFAAWVLGVMMLSNHGTVLSGQVCSSAMLQ